MKLHWMRRLVRIELVLIFLVVLAGSVVRMTGSGMGCPDWPKCFGHLIPPTEMNQVIWHPNTYFQSGQMIVRDSALWSAKSHFTSGETYNPNNWERYTVHNYAIFNPWHTWTEYINRLFGAASGVPMFFLAILGLTLIRSKPLYTVLSVAGILLLGFEAWLGKVVVDGHLIPGQITYHMLGAFVLIVLMVVFLHLLNREKADFKTEKPPLPVYALLLTLIVVFVQVVLGTQVRESVDEMVRQFGDGSRDGWSGMLTGTFYIHRTFSWVVTGLIFAISYKCYRSGWVPGYVRWSFILVLLSMISGALLYYLDLPRYIQPFHLMLSAGIVVALTSGILNAYVFPERVRNGKK